MPTYEYECTACGQHIEVYQRFSEDALTTCGACGGALRKVFHPAGIVFKGSGFYATDSRSKPAAADAKTEKKGGKKESAPASSESGSTGSSEKTSEKKSETKKASSP